MSDAHGLTPPRSPSCVIFILLLQARRCSEMRQYRVASFAAHRRQACSSLRIRAYFQKTGIDFPHQLPLNLRAMVNVRRFG